LPKRNTSIGKDVLKSGKKLLPKKAELTIKSPVFSIIELKLAWERGKITEEEYKRKILEFKLKNKKQARSKKPRHKSKPYV
jgi:hypothetical protein